MTFWTIIVSHVYELTILQPQIEEGFVAGWSIPAPSKTLIQKESSNKLLAIIFIQRDQG